MSFVSVTKSGKVCSTSCAINPIYILSLSTKSFLVNEYPVMCSILVKQDVNLQILSLILISE